MDILAELFQIWEYGGVTGYRKCVEIINYLRFVLL